jgi:hypothetical protein
MSTTVSGFRTRFPEFSNATTYPDPRVQLFLDDAVLCVSETVYKQFTDLAVYYLAAHELFLATKTSDASGGGAQNIGPVSSKSAGQVSVSRAVGSLDLKDSDSYYLQTIYGQKYLSIRDKVKVPGFMVVNKVRFQ